MPVAHVCPLCGNQLARTRAVLDAVYGMPIVRCDCGHVAIRRRHPITRRWRRAIRVAMATATLALQLFIVAFFSVLTVFSVRGLSDDIRNLKHRPLSFVGALLSGSRDHERVIRAWGIEDNGFFALAGFVALALVTGVWLRIGLSHWRWPRQLFAWIALISLLMWMDVLLYPFALAIRKITGETTGNHHLPTVSQSIDFITIFAGCLLFTLPGALVGHGLSRLGPMIRSFFYSRRIKRLRKRRHAG